MRLLDQIIQCRAPFIVQDTDTGKHTQLSGAMEGAMDLKRCPVRYVLDNALTALCADLAYSKGTTVFSCVDLIRVPARSVWVEWCDKAWQEALQRNGFTFRERNIPALGHYGLLINSSVDGLRGVIRAFWSNGGTEAEVYASAAQARFYLDGTHESAGGACDHAKLRVHARGMDPAGVLGRCFHFEFEETWARYYQRVAPRTADQQAILHQSTGCVAHAIPVLLAFFLLLSARAGLPQRLTQLARLNRARAGRGRPPLEDHIEVRAPLLPEYRPVALEPSSGTRRTPRLHHVRGHLVRRNDQIFWRVPHLRGKADAGVLKSRTVVWRFDSTAQRRPRRALGSMP